MTTSALPSTAPTATGVVSHDEPTGVAPRGTLVVLVGRGESPSLYGRFGRRLAADAYKVRVVDVDLAHVAATRTVVRSILDDPTLPGPRVLVGSDSGALLALTLADDPGVDALVLAGTATPESRLDADWDGELEARTACPAHRKVIGDDAAFAPGALAQELPSALADTPVAATTVPTLVIHGDADEVTPASAVAALAAGPRTEAHLVAGGRHDVLNDVTHRSVAATIVLFLERLKLGRDLPVIVRPGGPGGPSGTGGPA